MKMKLIDSNQQIEAAQRVNSSFRDPGAQVYELNGVIYREIYESSHPDYLKLMSSGLYDALSSRGLLIKHEEVGHERALNPHAKVIIKPEIIPFISYPYEWSFSQLKDAALLTLEIAKTAIEYGMILKDASAYNIQFYRGKPVLIDTSSLTIYEEGTPWIAYNQFCRHFLAPLALMANKDVRLNCLCKQFIDGIPLDLASTLLPSRTKLSLSLFIHIHVHARAQQKFSDSAQKVTSKQNISKVGLLGLLDSLTSAINKQRWKPIKTEWSDYYTQTNYTDKAAEHKSQVIEQYVNKAAAKAIWDLGANNGFYSRVAAKTGADVISFDIDPVAVESNYIKVKQEKNATILPLLQDLTAPSPNIGWSEGERDGFKERASPDLVMALALIHHLAISNNVPLTHIAELFSSLADYLIIEFVPKEDSQVQRLLSSRPDIFPTYHLEGFKSVFSNYYTIVDEVSLHDSQRTLFLMKRR